VYQVDLDTLDDLHRDLLEAHARLELKWPVRLATVVSHLSFAHYVRIHAYILEKQRVHVPFC
jgi:hypothetical protein